MAQLASTTRLIGSFWHGYPVVGGLQKLILATFPHICSGPLTEYQTWVTELGNLACVSPQSPGMDTIGEECRPSPREKLEKLSGEQLCLSTHPCL